MTPLTIEDIRPGAVIYIPRKLAARWCLLTEEFTPFVCIITTIRQMVDQKNLVESAAYCVVDIMLRDNNPRMLYLPISGSYILGQDMTTEQVIEQYPELFL